MARIDGVEKLAAQLKELGAQAGGKTLRAAALSASLPALKAIQAAAPVGDVAHRTYKGRLVAPGFLRRNIRRKALLHTDRSKAIVLIGPAQEAFYAEFLEKGTLKMSAQPFMEQGFDASKQDVVDRLMTALRRGIDRVRAKGAL